MAQSIRFERLFQAASSTSARTVLIVVGFVSGESLLDNLWKIAFPWFYVDFPIALFTLSFIVMRLFKPYAKFYGYLLLISVSWIVSIMIGRLVSGFWVALTGLFPFYQNPFVIAYWADYFTILACLVYAQDRVGKLLTQWHHKFKTTHVASTF